MATGAIGIDFLWPQVKMETLPLSVHIKWKQSKLALSRFAIGHFSQSRNMTEEGGIPPGFVKPNYPPPYEPAPPPEVWSSIYEVVYMYIYYKYLIADWLWDVRFHKDTEGYQQYFMKRGAIHLTYLPGLVCKYVFGLTPLIFRYFLD